MTAPSVLLVGGTCDLALATAQRLLAEGRQPLLTCRDEAGRERIVQALGEPEGRYAVAFLPLGDRGALTALFDAAGASLEALVDFAQSDYESLVASSDPQTVQRYFDENVAFRADLLREAARCFLPRRRGRLVFVSSAAAARLNPGQGFYAAAKLAAEALYRALGVELALRGITTVSLRPGYVAAGRGKRYLERTGGAALEKTPLRRAVTAEEVAGTIVYLLGPDAAALNATEITLDGGFLATK